MRIHSLSYTDKAFQWTLEPISFDKLTLLVGVSGVGKTQTLRTILKLRDITKGDSLNGVSWSIRFSTVDNNEYLWKGEFENRGIEDEQVLPDIFSSEDDQEERDAAKIISEALYLNGKVIVERDPQAIIFNGVETVKLPPAKITLVGGLHLLLGATHLATRYGNRGYIFVP